MLFSNLGNMSSSVLAFYFFEELAGHLAYLTSVCYNFGATLVIVSKASNKGGDAKSMDGSFGFKVFCCCILICVSYFVTSICIFIILIVIFNIWRRGSGGGPS